MTSFRIPAWGRLGRSRPLLFSFNGRQYSGYEGDTLASALLANDVQLVGRSFKYHRPRGILTAGVEEPNAIVQLEKGAYTQPNLRATQIELYDNLEASSVHAWPSVNFDLGMITGAFARMLVAGFYYKTFKWPRRLWHSVYEPTIRKLAGLGTAPRSADPDLYDKTHVHADVLVVGSGPAGLAAALSAARTGARVILAEQNAQLGGYLPSTSEMASGQLVKDWADNVIAELTSLTETTVLRRTTAFGYYDQNYVLLVERRTDHLRPGSTQNVRQRLWHVRAKKVIFATGAHERPLVFSNNDRPGIMLASAVSDYLVRFGVSPGRSVAVFTNNDSAYAAALNLNAAGVHVAAIVDTRQKSDGRLVSAAQSLGIPIIAGSVVANTVGRSGLSAIEVRSLTGMERRHIQCDALAISGGWSPVVHLWSHAQGPLRWDEFRACFVPTRPLPQVRCIGAANGTFDLYGGIAEGVAAGAEAALASGFNITKSVECPSIERSHEGPIECSWQGCTNSRKAFVDYQSDVTVQDLQLAVREGMKSVEHVKRYTTTGMATDQGKTSNVNAVGILSQSLRKPISDIGVTTFRPPYSPVTIGALAGRDRGSLIDPIRVTPMHSWHVEHGAAFEDVGQWKRAWYYPVKNEDLHGAVRRESLAARTAVGIQDVSTLGKIDVQGPDAAEFLDRIYTNAFRKLGINRCRYGIMCRDDGMVFDDGVTTRITDNHFFMTTTTGGAGRVLDWLEELLQTDWLNLRVFLTSVTEQWAATAIAGPRARELLRDMVPDLALDNESFPFLSMRDATVAGIPARIFRISFSGELAYEIHVASDFGLALWEVLFTRGQKYGITPYGTETMHLLRAEKGFIIVGQETDGTVTPIDLQMDWIVSKQKEFIGRRSLRRLDTARSGRKRLVGLLPINTNEVLPEGAQVVDKAPLDLGLLYPYVSAHLPRQLQRGRGISIGHVTSSYWSPNLGRSFALALINDGHTKTGTSVFAPVETHVIEAKIVEPIFIDKEGQRQNA